VSDQKQKSKSLSLLTWVCPLMILLWLHFNCPDVKVPTNAVTTCSVFPCPLFGYGTGCQHTCSSTSMEEGMDGKLVAMVELGGKIVVESMGCRSLSRCSVGGNPIQEVEVTTRGGGSATMDSWHPWHLS